MSDVRPEATRVMTLYGQSMTRTGGIFGLGFMAVVPFGIVSLAVTTRLLDTDDFGRLAVLFSVASITTVLCGLGIFQGTFISVYGLLEDDGGDSTDAFDIGGETEIQADRLEATSHERRRLLGSGLVLIIATSTILCSLVALVGTVLAVSVFGSSWIAAILWMVASAWTGSLWRMVHQVPRMERRPGRWAALQALRPALVLAGTIAALVGGLGVSGVMMATAAGTLAASAIAFLISRTCFLFSPRLSDASLLWAKGKPWVPLTLAVVLQSNVSVLLLSVLATPTGVALFQAANRIAQIPTYFADGFITGWPAMERSPISLAAKARKGRREYSASVFTLFALTTLGLLMFVSLSSGALIHIAAPSYNSAAGLIPIVAAAYGALSLFRGVYRATSFPLRRYWFMFLHVFWIAPYGICAALLIPLNPSYGVAGAQVVASIIVTVAFVAIDRRGSQPTPFQWRKMAFVLLAAAACVLVVQLAPGPPAAQAALSIAALLAFPILLFVSKTISLDEWRIVRSIVGSLIPRRVSPKDVNERLTRLSEPERQAVILLLCEEGDPRAVAATLGASYDLTLSRLTRGLRTFGDSTGSTPVDHIIGEYVLHPGTTIERDNQAAYLRSLGVDPLDLHQLDESKRLISRMGSRAIG